MYGYLFHGSPKRLYQDFRGENLQAHLVIIINSENKNELTK